jgi:hypothetical protein
MNRLHWSARFAGVALCLAIGHASADETAEAFLGAIYGQYAGTSPGVALDSPEAIRLYFEPALAQIVADDVVQAASDGDAPELEGDPFVDAQDWDITNLAIKVDAEGSDTATGHVRFNNFGEPHQITLDLVETSEGWRISDIEWAEGTLRGLYSH